jgi:redox-sensitive bicupin YhaK (pirin superfamily)
MSKTTQVSQSLAFTRSVSRVEDKVRLGPDSQVDDKAIIISARDSRATDPFLALAEDWFSEPGFEWHPHRGIETVTMVLDGVLEHGDNAGNTGALQPGDIQWMTAGRGIIHRELAFKNEYAHTLQLWVNLPKKLKMTQTGYQDLRASARPSVTTKGALIEVVSGKVAGTAGLAKNQHPIQGAVLTIEANAHLDYAIPSSHRAFLYVLKGEVSIGGRKVRAGQIAWSDPVNGSNSSLHIKALAREETSRVLTYSGTPLREPVVMGGPIVMNSRSEIDRAMQDYHSGKFGPVPRQPRLKRA